MARLDAGGRRSFQAGVWMVPGRVQDVRANRARDSISRRACGWYLVRGSVKSMDEDDDAEPGMPGARLLLAGS